MSKETNPCFECSSRHVEFRTTGYGMPVKEEVICLTPDRCPHPVDLIRMGKEVPEDMANIAIQRDNRRVSSQNRSKI